MNNMIKVIFSETKKYFQNSYAFDIFGFNPYIEYDILVLAPTYKPFNFFVDEKVFITELKDLIYNQVAKSDMIKKELSGFKPLQGDLI